MGEGGVGGIKLEEKKKKRRRKEEEVKEYWEILQGNSFSSTLQLTSRQARGTAARSHCSPRASWVFAGESILEASATWRDEKGDQKKERKKRANERFPRGGGEGGVNYGIT